MVRGARVVAIPRIEALAVLDVRVPNPSEARNLERERLSFDVQTKFHVRIERFEAPLPRQRRVKVGPETIAGLGDLFESVGAYQRLVEPQTEEVEILETVRVEANADPKFEAFSYESASLVSEGLSGSIRLGLPVGLADLM